MSYKTKYYETLKTIEVKEIKKEKNKEALYVIHVDSYGETTIPESTYLEYIGDENNAITLTVSEAYIYINKQDINHIIRGDYPGIHLVQMSLPWDNKVTPYSEDQIKETALSYVTGEIEENVSSFDISEEAIRFE